MTQRGCFSLLHKASSVVRDPTTHDCSTYACNTLKTCSKIRAAHTHYSITGLTSWRVHTLSCLDLAELAYYMCSPLDYINCDNISSEPNPHFPHHPPPQQKTKQRPVPKKEGKENDARGRILYRSLIG